MKVGLIDVDNYGKKKIRFPNLALMKISAWHKRQNDDVSWWWTDIEHFDRVYMSKVFSDEYTKPMTPPTNTDELIMGGTGYCISLENGKEHFCQHNNTNLPLAIEHIMPDYSLYGITDTAYGYMSRGCPRGCRFCHVGAKEGNVAHKVADLSEFWNGQKNIELCDPNLLACKQWREILQQLIDSEAHVDINQGLDIRLMTAEKAEMLKRVKIKKLHFAWDNPKDDLKQKFAEFAEINGGQWTSHGHNGTVYCLTNYGSTMEENLYRVYTLRDMGYKPYIMIYNKPNAPRELRMLQRWVNNPYIFYSCSTFEEYNNSRG